MQVRLRGSVSSQYLTALLMAAPLAEGPGSIDIVITDELVSQPYVAMTVGLMASFGVEVGNIDMPEEAATLGIMLKPELAVETSSPRVG